MKKSSLLLLVLCLLFSMSVNAFAESKNIQVVLDSKPLTLDSHPIIKSGRTLVPLRGIFEALDASISWDSKTQSVLATKGEISIQIQIGNQVATRNEQEISLDVPAKIINNRTYVPLRFIGESFGAQVTWDSKTSTIYITSPEQGSTDTGEMSFDEYTDYILDVYSIYTSGNYQLEFYMIDIEELDNELMVTLSVDSEQFAEIEKVVSSGNKQMIQDWMLEIFDETKAIYPDKELRIVFELYDTYEEEPTHFSDDIYVGQDEDGYYVVITPIIYIDDYFGELDISWRYFE